MKRQHQADRVRVTAQDRFGYQLPYRLARRRASGRRLFGRRTDGNFRFRISLVVGGQPAAKALVE